MTPRRLAGTAVGVTCAAMLLAACTGAVDPGSAGEASASEPSASVSASTAPSPSPSPTPVATTASPAPEPVNPLTGLPADERRPVLVVKLDNTVYAQPHAGLTRADVVYVEEVEYGITRLAAVFSGRVPTRIGPVRSARITDIDLLEQYDRPAFAFSGAQRKMLPVLAAAPFFDVSPGTGVAGYSRDSSRRAPYNYYLDGRVVLDRAPRASLAPDPGFDFDIDVPAGGLVARRARMEWGYSSAAFRYVPSTGLYAVHLNGQRAGAEERPAGQNAATVVIQYVKQRPSAYFDKGGGNTPHAQTIGTGRAVVLRDGLAWEVRWSRPTGASGTTFTLPDGSPLAFKPGQTWVVLLDRTRTARVRPLTEPPSMSAAPSSSPSSSPSAPAPSSSGSPGSQ